jgi:hypothetical protein
MTKPDTRISNPMTMEQIELARHALGLTRRQKSFRNRFWAAKGHQDYENWMEMANCGNAEFSDSPLWGGDRMFRLTRQGAQQTLKDGESLCMEDFPV